jgi:hypothetical protein
MIFIQFYTYFWSLDTFLELKELKIQRKGQSGQWAESDLRAGCEVACAACLARQQPRPPQRIGLGATCAGPWRWPGWPEAGGQTAATTSRKGGAGLHFCYTEGAGLTGGSQRWQRLWRRRRSQKQEWGEGKGVCWLDPWQRNKGDWELYAGRKNQRRRGARSL